MMKKRILVASLVLTTLLTACAGQTAETSESVTNDTTTVKGEDQFTIDNGKNSAVNNVDGEEMAMTDEEQILAEYNRFQQAMVDKDTDTLRKMLGNTTVRHITGRTQTVDEWLSDVENEEMKYYSIKITNPEVVIDGDTATLSCSNVIDARIYGSRGTWTLSGGGYFEKVDGQWKMTQR